KLWNKPAAVAAAEGEGEEAKSAAAKDPFESGSFSKKLDKPTKKFDIDRYNQSIKSASRDPYDAAPPEPAKAADPYDSYPMDREVVRTSYDEIDSPDSRADETPPPAKPNKKAKPISSRKKPAGGSVRASDIENEPYPLDAGAPNKLPAEAEPLDASLDPIPDESFDSALDDARDTVEEAIDDYGRDPIDDYPATSENPFGGSKAPVDAPSALGRTGAAAGVGAAAGAALAGIGLPGDEKLEGAQKPVITIEKFAPDEVQIGKEALFEIAVRNEGNATAHNVQVVDQVPQGTKLANTEPEIVPGRDGQLNWSLETMQPGEEKVLQFRVIPTEEGEIGSVAQVMFTAKASVRTISTRPKLALEVECPKQILIGERLALKLRTSNPGTGASTGILIEAALPENLEHQAGTELEYDLGDLQPNESRDLDLALKAVKPGIVTLILSARGDAGLQAEQQVEVEILAPALAVGLTGAKRRYLEREASFVVTVSNPGTAPAKDIELTTYLPDGMQFVKADNFGEYDAKSRAIRWSLAELPAGETGEVTLVAVPMDAGEQTMLIETAGASGLADKQEYPIQVEGVAAILFEVVDVNDPVDVGGEMAYEIRVVNQGSKAATDVRIVVGMSEGMEPIDAEAPVEHGIEQNQFVFDALAQLAPKADTTFHVRAKALTPGDHRISVQLQTNEMRTPVTKEESTRVLPKD
ncbi:MAG: hypothetical protein AB7I37_17265, partial [Pirellulales bacterium]